MSATHKTLPTLLLSALLVLAGCGPDSMTQAANQRNKEAAQRGEALFNEKCKSVAGEKIYRTVPDVEGILLLKVRPQSGDQEWADLMWPGAAFALESVGDGYITTFLGYEHSSREGEPVTPDYRGYIGTDYQARNASNLRGYRYVDVIDEKDGKRYRYSGSHKNIEVPGDKLYGDGKPHIRNEWVLERTPAPDPAPRYGVTFEDHVIPEERELGLASSTVKVIDLQTNEVLGELIRYAWGAPRPSAANPSPWLTAWKCPGHPVGAEAATRKFVDQILIPKKDN